MGNFYSEFSTAKQIENLLTSITSMSEAKAQKEFLAHQNQCLYELDNSVALWTTNNRAFKLIMKKSELLSRKFSAAEYGMLEDNQRGILQSQVELEREMNERERVPEISQLF